MHGSNEYVNGNKKSNLPAVIQVNNGLIDPLKKDTGAENDSKARIANEKAGSRAYQYLATVIGE